MGRSLFIVPTNCPSFSLKFPFSRRGLTTQPFLICDPTHLFTNNQLATARQSTSVSGPLSLCLPVTLVHSPSPSPSPHRPKPISTSRRAPSSVCRALLLHVSLRPLRCCNPASRPARLPTSVTRGRGKGGTSPFEPAAGKTRGRYDVSRCVGMTPRGLDDIVASLHGQRVGSGEWGASMRGDNGRRREGRQVGRRRGSWVDEFQMWYSSPCC